MGLFLGSLPNRVSGGQCHRNQQGTGANQGRVMVGMNPSRISAAKGKTISFRNKLTVQSAEYELIITYRYR